MVWGILVGEVGWRGCVFLSTVCQVVEELGEVVEGEVWVSRKGLPGLDRCGDDHHQGKCGVSIG